MVLALLILMAPPATAASPLEPPRAALSPPGTVVISPTPAKVVTSNVRAASLLYAARHHDEMGLFQAADAVTDAFAKGKLPLEKSTGGKPSKGSALDAETRLRAYDAARGDRLKPAERASFIQFVADLVQAEFEAAVTDAIKQMESYASLVAAVSESVDAFTQDNVSSERDHLAEHTQKAAGALALSMSNHAYGGAHYAASKLAAQARDASALLSQRAILDAYGVSSKAELIAKLTGKGAGEIQRIERRGEAGARLIAALADNTDLLEASSKRRELARRLASFGAPAKEWLSVKPVRVPGAVAKKLRPLCFDADRKVVPCKVTTP